MEILLIDDQPNFASKLKGLLESRGHQTHYFQSGLDVLKLKDEELTKYEMAIIDRQMPDCDGLEIGKELKKRQPHIVTVMLTVDDSKDTIIRALRDSKFDDYLSKRELVKDLVAKQYYLDETLYRAVSLIETQRKLKETEQALTREVQLTQVLHEQSVTQSKGMVGQSKEFKTLLKMIHKVASTEVTVLIRGETGTGKELVAREVHKQSLRSKAPFVAINCAAIPRELLESELFGHEKGAFTGADNTREGFVKMADGGSLFLDEIGDMPLELQSKLLRVLQEKELLPVGGRKPIKVDVRIISATHQNLRKKVQLKEFREDLYYRLNVFPIHVPPLRDRLEDLEPLINYFIQQKSSQVRGVSPQALDHLKQFPWNGNIRELENIVDRSLIEVQGDMLQLENFLAYENLQYLERPNQSVSDEKNDDSQNMRQNLGRASSESVIVSRRSLSFSNEPLWKMFEENGFKLWRIVNEISLHERLGELLKKAVYEKRGRFAVLLFEESLTLPVKLQYVHSKTHQLEEITINFLFFNDFDEKPSANGRPRNREIPPPNATVSQEVLKGLPDTYIFDILYPRIKKIAWDQFPPHMLMRATILRYAQTHASQKTLKSILGEVLSYLINDSLATLLPGLRQNGVEAVRACLTSPSHIFSGISSRLRVNPEFIENEIQKVYPDYSRPLSTHEYS